MTIYLMADSELDEYRALESRAQMVDAATIQEAIKEYAPMSYNGDTATIQIRGMLTPERIGFLDFFGEPQTVYGDVVDQIAQAEQAGLKNLILETDSGGGEIDGMFETMDAIAKSPLNITGRIVGQAQSAAYMLLSQSDVIESTREYNFVGSIGVKIGVSDSKEISNSDSPHKIAGAKTEDGKYAVQSTLDEVYSMIVPRMATGRNTTAEHIKEQWGKGATMTAKTALARGMIDAINEPIKAGRSGITKGKAMNKEQLKAEHPDLYSAILAEGKEIGKAEAKELASAHAELAKMSGDVDRAISDIVAGAGITPTCQVHHTTMATKRAMITARVEENVQAIGDGVAAIESVLANDENDESKNKAAWAAAGLEVEL